MESKISPSTVLAPLYPYLDTIITNPDIVFTQCKSLLKDLYWLNAVQTLVSTSRKEKYLDYSTQDKILLLVASSSLVQYFYTRMKNARHENYVQRFSTHRGHMKASLENLLDHTPLELQQQIAIHITVATVYQSIKYYCSAEECYGRALRSLQNYFLVHRQETDSPMFKQAFLCFTKLYQCRYEHAYAEKDTPELAASLYTGAIRAALVSLRHPNPHNPNEAYYCIVQSNIQIAKIATKIGNFSGSVPHFIRAISAAIQGLKTKNTKDQKNNFFICIDNCFFYLEPLISAKNLLSSEEKEVIKSTLIELKEFFPPVVTNIIFFPEKIPLDQLKITVEKMEMLVERSLAASLKPNF